MKNLLEKYKGKVILYCAKERAIYEFDTGQKIADFVVLDEVFADCLDKIDVKFPVYLRSFECNEKDCIWELKGDNPNSFYLFSKEDNSLEDDDSTLTNPYLGKIEFPLSGKDKIYLRPELTEKGLQWKDYASQGA